MQTTMYSNHAGNKKAVILITVCLLLACLSIDYPDLVEGSFFSDSATYYSLAMSLVGDFDLEYAQEDIQRIYADFSGGPSGIFLQRNPHSGLLYFGKSFIYPLWSAIFISFLGSDGFLFSHALLFGFLLGGIVKLWERRWGYWFALLIGLAATTATTALVFFFWVAPEYFNMVVLFYAYFFILYREINPPEEYEEKPGLLRRFFLSPVATPISFIMVGLATFSKISNGIYFVPLFLFLIYKRRLKDAAIGLIVFAIVVVGLFGIQYQATGNWNYQGGERTSFQSEFPYANNQTFYSASGTTTETNLGEYEFPFFPIDIANNITYLLFGRFGGMIAYFAPAFLIILLLLSRRIGAAEITVASIAVVMTIVVWSGSSFWSTLTQISPFILPVALALILLTGLRMGSAAENMVLLSILASAMVFIIMIPTNVIGGGGTVGNRYFFNIYPLVFFLLPLKPKKWFPFASFAVALFFIGHILFNPLQYSRFPYSYGSTDHLKLLPVEYTMINDLPINTFGDRRRMPWYAVEGEQAARWESGPEKGQAKILFYVYHLDNNSFTKEPNPKAWYTGPDGKLTRDLVLPSGGQQIWTKGGEHAEFILRSGKPFKSITVKLGSAGVANRGWIELNGERFKFELDKYSSESFSFSPGNPYTYNYLNPSTIYHLEVKTETGIAPRTMAEAKSNDYRYLGVKLEFDVKE